MEKIYDPDLYAQLSAKPFESSETAQKSLNSFFSEVRELRAKYGLRDVTTVVVVPVVTKDETGTECIGELLQGYHNGDVNLYPKILYAALEQQSAIELQSIQDSSDKVDDSNARSADYNTQGVETIVDLVAYYAVTTKEQALKFMAVGDVMIDKRVVLENETIPDQEFTLTVKGMSLKIPTIAKALEMISMIRDY